MSHNIALNGKIYNDIREIKVPLAEDTLTYKSYVANEGALTIITADSAENLPSDAEENTIAFVSAQEETVSWNDLKDKPFYEEIYEGEMTITYDGNPEGKTVVEATDGEVNILLVKASEWTTTPEYLIGANVVIGGVAGVIQEEDISDFRSEGYPALLMGQICFMVFEPLVFQGIVFSEPGTYIFDRGVAASITYTGISTRIHQVPKKYLPVMPTASGNTGSSAVGNVHIIDIGDQDLNIEDLDLAAYKEGDVLLIIQNQDENQV